MKMCLLGFSISHPLMCGELNSLHVFWEVVRIRFHYMIATVACWLLSGVCHYSIMYPSTHYFKFTRDSTYVNTVMSTQNGRCVLQTIFSHWFPRMTIIAFGRHRPRQVLPSFNASICPSVRPERYRSNSLRISAISLKFCGMMYSTIKQIVI